jgi:plastocyanin
MLLHIQWRRRTVAWVALAGGSALLLAVACAPHPTFSMALGSRASSPAPLRLATPSTIPLSAHAAMHMDMAPGALALAAPVAARPADLAAASPAIDIQAFQYAAPVLTVPVGTTVTWTNLDVEPHTVTSNTRAFASAGLETGDTFAFRFDTPGTYAYHCALHPFMTAQIVVQ